MCFRKKLIPQVQNGLVQQFLMDNCRILSVVIIIAYASSHLREKVNVFRFFYDWGPQDFVLVSSNLKKKTFKIVRIYEVHLKQCLEKFAIRYNVDNIRINR